MLHSDQSTNHAQETMDVCIKYFKQCDKSMLTWLFVSFSTSYKHLVCKAYHFKNITQYKCQAIADFDNLRDS